MASAPTLQLLAWIAERPRTYAETMDAWRTSCPRLSIWEDAVGDRLVRVEGRVVALTAAGCNTLEAHGAQALAAPDALGLQRSSGGRAAEAAFVASPSHEDA